MIPAELEGPRMLLVLMVKNESRILERCLEAALPFVDAALLADTGSSDDTVAVFQAVMSRKDKPHKVSLSEWRDFGHNRSLSLEAARDFAIKELEWPPESTFALVLDADMKLRGEPLALRAYVRACQASGVLLKQHNGGLEYYNMRIMRLSDAWYCEGVTHEYWTGGGVSVNAPSALGWIEDVGDGGAKADKFVRDERLLLKGLAERPSCERYMFYLAQTYHCLNRHLDAIEWYKKRIAAGGWVEEVWYSHLMLARTFLVLKKPFKAELWVHLGRELQPDRVEGLLSGVTYFREQGLHFKAWHYLKLAEAVPKPADGKLFLEVDAYGHKLTYERSILHFYVYPKELAEGAMCGLGYQGPMEHSVLSNLCFYASPLRDVSWKRLEFPAPEGYTSSSVAVNAEGLLCVRTVSYRITERGEYVMPSGRVETRNFSARWDGEAAEWSEWAEVCPEAGAAERWRREDYILGLEDVRLFGDAFTATTREFSYCASNRMVHGRYPDMTFRPVRPPNGETACEKNWLPISDTGVIYGWHPLVVGEVGGEDEVAELTVRQTHETPSWFRHLRGSAPPVALAEGLWVLTHVACPRAPRSYLHLWVVLDKLTLRPISHTPPFFFKHNGIEYCLGATASPDGEEFRLFVSVWDRESWFCRVPVRVFREWLRPV